MYIRHVDEEEQKIEMWLWPDPDKGVERQAYYILKGLFITIREIIRMPKEKAMHELRRLAEYLIAFTEGRGIAGHTTNSGN